MSSMFHVIFLLRRLVYAMSIAFLIEYLYAQLMLMMILSTFMITYAAYYKPYEMMILNYLEVYNECTVMAILYCCLAFTDFVTDPYVKH